jgi:Protein of unknown function (DUF3168)
MQDFYDAIKELAGGEVYALVAPQDAQYPAIVYTPIVQEHIFGIDGPSGLQRIRVQVDTYARTYQKAYLTQELVLDALLTNKSSVVDVRMGLTSFEEQARLYRVSVDYTYHR